MSTYRDERDAAHAQNTALQQENASLTQSVGALTNENTSLRAENDDLRGRLGMPTSRKRRPMVFAAIGAVVLALLAAGVFLNIGTSRPPPSTMTPSVAPSSVATPIPPIVPTVPSVPTPPPMIAPPT